MKQRPPDNDLVAIFLCIKGPLKYLDQSKADFPLASRDLQESPRSKELAVQSKCVSDI